MDRLAEIERLEVFGESDVGWCEHTPPNETVDAYGNPSIEALGFSARDPRAPRRRRYDDPEVCRLREYLGERNGLRGVEICAPDEVERAARIFRRDGFVVVRDLLDAERLARWRQGCARVLREILRVPGQGDRKYMTETARLPHRYSYGTSSASRQLLHEIEWAEMIDLETTTPLLARMFGGMDYAVLGAGGDLCLPGAIEYQTLHADVREGYQLPPERLAQAERLGVELRRDEHGELTEKTRQLIIALTPPMITINFLMSDLTFENGPIRQIPGTHTHPQSPPTQEDEPEWMRLSTLVGAPAGAGVFRDNRAWHGATPNVSREIRAMPNVEYGAPWLDASRYRRTMPHAVWQDLTPHAQHLCRFVVAEPGVWPTGAGVMHPLDAERRAVNPDLPGTGKRPADRRAKASSSQS